MKKRRGLLLVISIALIALIISGCGQRNTVSDKQLINYYAQSINGLSKVIDGYSQSLETGTNYVNDPATRQIEWIDKTESKLKKDAPDNKKSKYLYNFMESLEDEIKEYKNNDFNGQESVSNDITNNRKKFEKSLNVDDSSKVSEAKSNANKSAEKLQKVLALQPHVDGKKVINKDGEITFDSVSEVPGFEGEKTVEIKYTYKNTTNEPKSAYNVLLESGDFTQESSDSVDTLEMGIVDSDWDEAHPTDHQMYNDETMSKLKSGAEKQYATFIKVNDFDSPIIFKATDLNSNTEIGKIKLSIDQS